jgi:arylsulfatase
LPGKIEAGADCAALTGHLDIYRTLAQLAGATLSEKSEKQAEGRSLLPLLQNPTAEWTDRTLVTHAGRWNRGQAAGAKHSKSAIRNSRYSLVENKELYDLQADPGESKNIIEQHPEVVAQLRKAYDRWWEEALPLMVNEDAVGPKVNPFKAQYWKQFGGGPDDDKKAKPARPRRKAKGNA